MPYPRILALDLGERRIGLAVSDPLGLTAQGLPTLERRNKRSDFESLQRLIEEYQPVLVLVGHPLRMSGQVGIQAEKAAAFADELNRRSGVEVRLWDERLTTKEAHRALSEGGATLNRRRKSIDRMSAVILLQSYLDQPQMQADQRP